MYIYILIPTQLYQHASEQAAVGVLKCSTCYTVGIPERKKRRSACVFGEMNERDYLYHHNHQQPLSHSSTHAPRFSPSAKSSVRGQQSRGGAVVVYQAGVADGRVGAFVEGALWWELVGG